MTQHHWQCVWNCDQGPECDCGVSGPRAWHMDLLPHDRAPTEAEVAAWRAALAHEDELGAAGEPSSDPETPNA